MATNFSHSNSLTKFIIIIEFVLVAYLIYALTKNVYNSYLVDRYVDTFKEENLQIELENKAKTQDYLYFTSEEYIDKIAKQNLGLINPGEEIIILSSDVIDAGFDDATVDDLPDYARYDGDSIPRQWWNLFFDS